MERLHFITAPFPGVTRWLENGAAEGMWGLSVMEPGKNLEVPAAEAYGVGAWHMAYTSIYEEVRKAGAPFGVAWSSSPQESDTGRTQAELMYLIALTQAGGQVRPDWFACLHPALAAALPNALHLPAPVHLEEVPVQVKEPWIGFFVPPTEKKAIFSQLLAVRAFQRDHREVRLQTNLEKYKVVMDWLGIEYDLHPWLPRQDYLKLLGRCVVVLHASLAESFGYGAVDAMMVNTRVVGSEALPWLPLQWRVQDANNPLQVQELLEAMYYTEHVADPRRWVKRLAEKNNAAAWLAMEAIVAAKPK